MNFYNKVIALALLQSGHSPLLTSFTMYKAGIFEKPTPVLIDQIKTLQSRYKLVETMLLEKIDSIWMLHSADRSVCVTEGFLATCAPDWAQELLNAMAEKAA